MNRHRTSALVLSLVCAAVLAGCVNPIKGLLVTRSAKEKEIEAVKVEYAAKIADAQSAVSKEKDKVIAGKDTQIQGAAASFYGHSLVFQSIVSPTRTDLIQRNLSVEGWAALGNVPPTAEAMKAMNERLAKELDATKTTLNDLQANHVKALAENAALAEATRKHEQALKDAAATLAKTEQEGAAKLAAKQAELVAVQDKLIAAEKARADDAAALQALKTKMSVILGLLALVGVAGAIYSPAMKAQCAVFGAVCGAASIGIWFVQPWHIALVAGVGLVGAGAWALVKYRKEERLSDALVLAAQDVKETSVEAWAKIGPAIEERLKRYVKKGGKLVAEKDHSIEAHIEQKKADWDRL